MGLKYHCGLAGLLCGFIVGCNSDESCPRQERDAREFVELHQTCSRDADCKWGPEIECFGACGTVISQSTDAKQFRSEGEKLASEYKSDGCECGEPSCADLMDLKPACVQGLCGWMPLLDASAPDR